MKNTIEDLNNHLFEQLERLNDDSLNEEQLDAEVKRSKAMVNISMTLIKSGELTVKAAEAGMTQKSPKLLLGNQKDAHIQ